MKQQMTNTGRRIVVLSLVLLLGVGCSPAAGGVVGPSQLPSGGQSPQEGRQPQGTLRIAYSNEPATVASKFASQGLTAYNDLVNIFNAFLTFSDLQGVAHPMLARTIPSRENGDWIVNADGSMVTTYRLRENAKWHDGRQITADDYVFAYQVYTDPEVQVVKRDTEGYIRDVVAKDQHTVVITWKQPYVYANSLGVGEMVPLPRHLLEEKYRTSSAAFVDGPEWTVDYVSAGPFRVERWQSGSSLIARANYEWFLGPPKLATLDIRFMGGDPNTVIAALLSGEVDVSHSPHINATGATAVRDRWVGEGGHLGVYESGVELVSFQFREVPNWQRAITDLRVRQALMHAIDRASLAHLITVGLTGPADVFLPRSDPLFAEVDRLTTKYPFDSNRAAALLADAGWHRRQGAGLLTDGAGRTLDVEMRGKAGQSGSEQRATIIADNWKDAGINSKIFVVPAALSRDNEFLANFPATSDQTRSITDPLNYGFTSDQAPTPRNRFVGRNEGSFYDPEVDRLRGLLLVAIDPNDWRQAVLGLHKRVSETLPGGALHYSPSVFMAKNKLKGPSQRHSRNPAASWNVWEWEVTDGA